MTIEIYGAGWCTFCKQAVSLCENKAVPYTYIDIDDSANLRSLEQRMGSKPKSVPQIFMDNRHLTSGFTGLQQELAKI